MNKTDLVKAVAATGISQEAAKKAIDAAVAAVKGALVSGESVQLIGFGTFSVVDKPAREGVNPATGEKIHIAAKRVAKFKPGKELAEAVK
jgi:DNA-binding protein HU-beta